MSVPQDASATQANQNQSEEEFCLTPAEAEELQKELDEKDKLDTNQTYTIWLQVATILLGIFGVAF